MKSISLKKFLGIGILFTIIVGSLLHFAYDFSNQNPFIGIFSPINESVWEHFKLGFYSLLLFAILVYPKVKDQVSNYIFGLGISSLVLNMFIAIIFYTYTSFTSSSILLIDILTYFLACILAMFIFYKIIKLPSLPDYFADIGLLILALSFVLFTAYTFNPPKLPIFISPGYLKLF